MCEVGIVSEAHVANEPWFKLAKAFFFALRGVGHAWLADVIANAILSLPLYRYFGMGSSTLHLRDSEVEAEDVQGLDSLKYSASTSYVVVAGDMRLC